MSNIRVNLLSPVLFYQTPIDILQTQNGSTQVNGVPTEIYSCRGCNQNLASNNPASQYQRQKLIQNTVRVQSSLYTMNLAGLSGYQKPSSVYQLVEQAGTPYLTVPHVYWNQMSDRAKPAHQVATIASGTIYHTSSTKHTITRNRPGAMSPGGIGVDIKHNSYERRLNKLKGKNVLRRGIIPPKYGSPIIFNQAYPVYGGKVVKTAIINGCDCPEITDNLDADKRIYGSESNAIQDKILDVTYMFTIGDFVWAKKNITDTKLYKAQIIAIDNDIYTIRFIDDDKTIQTHVSSLSIYFDCNGSIEPSIEEEILCNKYSALDIDSLVLNTSNLECNLLNTLASSIIL
jgi:hypothetical protein